MKRAWIALFCCLSLVALPAFADNTPDAENYVEIGAHGSDVTGDHNRVTEYNQAKTRVEGTLKLRMMNQKDDLKYKLDLAIFSNDDMKMNLVIHKGDWFTSTTSYNKFLHKLDHDRMANLQFRESVDPEINKPGGKFATHVDYDPNQDYFKVYEDLKQVFNFKLNTEIPADIEVGFRAQMRSGYPQTMQLSHCDTCHIQSKAAELDETTTDMWVKAHAKVANRFDVSYKFNYSKFQNDTDPTLYYIDTPRHPVSGGLVEEFSSRTNFGGEILESGYINDNEKTTHEVHVEGDVTKDDRVVAGASYSQLTNKGMDLDLTTTAGSFRWTHKFNRDFNLDAYLSYYTLDNDDVFVDIAPWRDGRPGGGQEMAFTRYSAYNRDVALLKLQGRYKVDAHNRLTFSYRYKQVSRDTLVVNVEDDNTDTTQNLFQVRWDGRYGDLNASATLAYETTDHPFLNATGIIEEPANGYSPLPGNGLVYYWQRVRTSEAGNLPNEDLNLRGNLSYRGGDNWSVNLNASYRDARNDELNSYQWDSTAINAGVNLFVVLNEKTVLTIGYDHSNMKSAALFTVPVMDG